MTEDESASSPERLPLWQTYLAWVVFCIFATIHVWIAMGSYLRQAFPDPNNPTYLDHALSTAVLYPNERVKETWLRRLENSLASLHYRSRFQSLVYIDIRNELGEPLPEQDVDHLIDGGSRWRVYGDGFRMAYAAKKPPLPDRRYNPGQPTYAFAYRLACVQIAEQFGIPRARQIEFHRENEPLRAICYLLANGCGLILLIAYIVRRRRRRIEWQGHPLMPASPADRDRLIVRTCQFMALPLIFYWPISRMLVGIDKEAYLFLWGMILPVALFITLAPFARKSLPLSSYLALSSRSLPRLTVIGVAAGLVFQFLMQSIAAITAPLFNSVSPLVNHSNVYDMADRSNGTLIAISLYLALLMAPIYEELLYRGSMLPALCGAFGTRLHPTWALRFGVLISALIFCLGHPYGISGWIGIGSFAVLQSFLVIETGSIYPAMVAHFVTNGLVTFLFLIGPR